MDCFFFGVEISYSLAALLTSSRGCSRRAAEPQAADLQVRLRPSSGIGLSECPFRQFALGHCGLPSLS